MIHLLLLLALSSHPRLPQVELVPAGVYDGGEGGLFLDIEGTVVRTDGSWYVADKLSYRVLRLSPSGNVLARGGRRGRLAGEFAGPGPIAAWRSSVAVADFASRRVQLLTPELLPRREFRTPGPIFDIHFDDAGRLWVASHGGGELAGILACYDSTGREVSRIRPHGVSDDLFGSVFQFAGAGRGLLCLAFLTQNCVEVWKTDGSFVREFMVPGLPSRSPLRRLGTGGNGPVVPEGNIFRSMTADGRGHLFLLGDEYAEHPQRDVYVCDMEGRLIAAAVLPEAATLIRCAPDGSLFAVTGRRDTVRRYLVRIGGS